MSEDRRIKVLRDVPARPDGRYVQYWIQQAMRPEGNAALDHAVELANQLGLSVVVVFGLTGGRSAPYPDANLRHYTFLLQGLSETAATLRKMGLAFTIRFGPPNEVQAKMAEDAALVVCDRGYLSPQRTWQRKFLADTKCRVVEVETDSVVPVEVASTKHEFGARTLRPKLHRVWEEFLVETRSPKLKHHWKGAEPRSDLDLSDPAAAAAGLKIDHRVKPVKRFAGGLSAARAQLDAFLKAGMDGYKDKRGEPDGTTVSHLSPYLHFGQISPIEIARAARAAKRGSGDDRGAFVEELVVRRELAHNHCWFEPNYARYEAAVPAWARKTLDEQRGDKRPVLYDEKALAEGRTHDKYWNGAMREMRETGYMHNRLRMYWGKKIIEWTASPEEAFETTMTLNNRFFVDGRDANSFTNVAWLFGLHDRPWFRRPVFGLVRYMGDATLKKFDADGYLRSVDELVAAEAA